MVNVDFLSLEFFCGLGMAWNLFVVCTFLSAQHRLLHVGMHHAGYEHRSRACVWFDSIWSTLVHSAFMVDPSVLAKLVLDGSPRRTLLQLTQDASRVDMISQWI